MLRIAVRARRVRIPIAGLVQRVDDLRRELAARIRKMIDSFAAALFEHTLRSLELLFYGGRRFRRERDVTAGVRPNRDAAAAHLVNHRPRQAERNLARVATRHVSQDCPSAESRPPAGEPEAKPIPPSSMTSRPCGCGRSERSAVEARSSAGRAASSGRPRYETPCRRGNRACRASARAAGRSDR